jgi:segregation and condensation protein B
MPDPVDVLEALLFASEGPVELERLREVLELPSVGQAQELVDVLRERLERGGRALQVVEVGGGVRLVTRPEVAPWLVRLARSRTRSRLSRPALETLAIVAYRQPVSRPEIDAVRGVNSEGVLDSLLERRLLRIGGRKDSAGRPFLYETTREFLIAFGLRDLGDLPKPEGDLVIPADAPEPATADAPGAAIAPPGDDDSPAEAASREP